TAPIVSNPIGIDGLGDIEDFFGPGMILILVGGAAAGAPPLIVRYRHGHAIERQQMKPVAPAAPLAAAGPGPSRPLGGRPAPPGSWETDRSRRSSGTRGCSRSRRPSRSRSCATGCSTSTC